MDIVGYIFSLIVTIETVYIFTLRDQRKRLERKLRRRTWEARGRDSDLIEHLQESELDDFMVRMVKDSRRSISMEDLEGVLLEAVREKVLKDRGEPVPINIDTLTRKLMKDKGRPTT